VAGSRIGDAARLKVAAWRTVRAGSARLSLEWTALRHLPLRPDLSPAELAELAAADEDANGRADGLIDFSHTRWLLDRGNEVLMHVAGKTRSGRPGESLAAGVPASPPDFEPFWLLRVLDCVIEADRLPSETIDGTRCEGFDAQIGPPWELDPIGNEHMEAWCDETHLRRVRRSASLLGHSSSTTLTLTDIGIPLDKIDWGEFQSI
jgi:hypothetical protein